MASLIEETDQQEERPGRNTVIQHLVNGAVEADLGEREDTQHHESEVADRRIRHQFLHIRLHQSHQAAVHDADDREGHDPRGVFARCRREHRQAETNQPVGAHFQHDGGQHHGSGRRSFHVGIRQPRMEREERNLNREREEEGEEQQRLFGVRQHSVAARNCSQNLNVIERADAKINEDDPRQHEHRARHRVQKEFDGGVNAAVVTPDADQEVHRHQHHFPEHIEEEEIPCGEDSDESKFEQEYEGEEFLGPVVNCLPGKQYGDRRQEGGQNHEPQAEAVDADVPVDFGTGNPDVIGDELLSGLAALETIHQTQRENEGRQRHPERQHLDGIFLRAWHQQRKNEPKRGKRNDQIEKVHRVTPSATPIRIRRHTAPSTTHVA